MRKLWNVQIARNPWLSLGLHIDHRDPSITFHLPGVLVAVGRMDWYFGVTGGGWSLRRRPPTDLVTTDRRHYPKFYKRTIRVRRTTRR